MNLKKILNFAKKNYLFSFFSTLIILVSFISFFKILFPSSISYVYAKVKVSRVDFSYAKGLQKGNREYDLLRRPIAEIIGLRYYNSMGTNTFDIYLTLKLKTSLNKRTKRYVFKRLPLAVGAIIPLEFPTYQIAGLVTGISQKKPQEKYIEKIITLQKSGAYQKDSPYVFNNIKIGDRYFDGTDYVFEVLEKKLNKSVWAVTNNLNAEVYERTVDTTQHIIVKAKVKLKEKYGRLIFAEEQIVTPGSTMSLVTDNSVFWDYSIINIE